MLEHIIQWDYSLILWMNQHLWPPLTVVMLFVTSNWFWVLVLGAVLYKITQLIHSKEFYWSFLGVILVFFVTERVSVMLFKNVFERLRPCHNNYLAPLLDLSTVQYELKLWGLKIFHVSACGGKYSFISSHSCNSMGLSLFLILLFHKKWPAITPILLSFTILTSLSRFYLAKHFLTDILSGWAVGALIAWIGYRVFMNYETKILAVK